MSQEAEIATRYRAHAKDLRTIADASMHLQTRRTLLNVAADYDRMAETLDAIGRANDAHLKRRSGS